MSAGPERFAITKLIAALVSVLLSFAALTVSVQSLRKSDETAKAQLRLGRENLERSGAVLRESWTVFVSRRDGGETELEVSSANKVLARQIPTALWKKDDVSISLRISNLGREVAVVSNFGPVLLANGTWYPQGWARDLDCSRQAFMPSKPCGAFQRIVPGDILFVRMRLRREAFHYMPEAVRKRGLTFIYEAGAYPKRVIRTKVVVPSRAELGF